MIHVYEGFVDELINEHFNAGLDSGRTNIFTTISVTSRNELFLSVSRWSDSWG